MKQSELKNMMVWSPLFGQGRITKCDVKPNEVIVLGMGGAKRLFVPARKVFKFEVIEVEK